METIDLFAPAILGIAYDVTSPEAAEWRASEGGVRICRANVARYHRNVLVQVCSQDLKIDLAAALIKNPQLIDQHPGCKLSNADLEMPLEGAPALRLGDWI